MHGKKSATVWLEPETHPENILNELEDRLIGRSDNGNGDERFDEEIKIGFPEFDDLIKIGNEGFKPHLSLGQFRDEVSAKNAINNFSSKFSSDPIIEFDVTELYWIIRKGFHDPFEIHYFPILGLDMLWLSVICDPRVVPGACE
ncbi:10616_t:CDS:2 [Entrophospora sp. SA101]|nr:10616_t:CDS:2 [Entrophospora sp. SA101]